MAVENTLSAGAILASKRKIETKICPVCKEEFEGIKKAKFCSNKCRQKDKYQRNKLTQ
ncbi:hypothetical protein [Bathymodiolus platifrons methanotrophic gill symbiont]|uniref:hypothetical protein n=1 Tax=Bathymodiolus platifrons methanotrophic gill symbiont TaxID=113268 RepID=UPI00142E2A40|nr:hypothetical protein [Bathymodiolus platifrons methanotrophic gill symbiont]